MLALVRTNSWTAVISSWLAGQKYFTHLQGSVNGMTRLIIGPATPVPTVKPVRKVKIRSRNICFFVANKRKNFSKLIVNIHPRHSYEMVDCLKNNLSHRWHWCARTYVSMNVYTTMWMLRALGFVVRCPRSIRIYRYMDDVTVNMFSLFCSTWSAVCEIISNF